MSTMVTLPGSGFTKSQALEVLDCQEKLSKYHLTSQKNTKIAMYTGIFLATLLIAGLTTYAIANLHATPKTILNWQKVGKYPKWVEIDNPAYKAAWQTLNKSIGVGIGGGLGIIGLSVGLTVAQKQRTHKKDQAEIAYLRARMNSYVKDDAVVDHYDANELFASINKTRKTIECLSSPWTMSIRQHDEVSAKIKSGSNAWVVLTNIPLVSTEKSRVMPQLCREFALSVRTLLDNANAEQNKEAHKALWHKGWFVPLAPAEAASAKAEKAVSPA